MMQESDVADARVCVCVCVCFQDMPCCPACGFTARNEFVCEMPPGCPAGAVVGTAMFPPYTSSFGGRPF